MPIKLLIVLLLLFSPCVSGSAEQDELSYIVAPADGAVISGLVAVIFGLRSPYGVAPAGVVKDNTGHHHLLIDTDLPDLNSPIPNDENHRHFGGGQTETVLKLPPGKHTLQLLLGDFAHIAHKPPVMSERITITVE
jgi:hypothetical protein